MSAYSVMMCTFKAGVVELMVEVLLLLVLEFYFLTYAEPDGFGFNSSILLCMSVDFKADVFRSQMVVPTYFIKPYSGITRRSSTSTINSTTPTLNVHIITEYADT